MKTAFLMLSLVACNVYGTDNYVVPSEATAHYVAPINPVTFNPGVGDVVKYNVVKSGLTRQYPAFVMVGDEGETGVIDLSVNFGELQGGWVDVGSVAMGFGNGEWSW